MTIPIGPDQFAGLAARALAPRKADVISLAHLHAPAVSVRDQAVIIVDRLRRQATMTFRALTGDAPDMITTVARFLALLELFREGAVAFEQLTPLGELTIRWTGTEDGELDISDEFDAAAPETVGMSDVTGAVEALLLLAVEPMSVTELAQAIDVPESVVAETAGRAGRVLRRDRPRLRAAASWAAAGATTPGRSTPS